MAAVTAAVVAVGAGAAMNAKAKKDASKQAARSSKWRGFGLSGGGGEITFGEDGQMISQQDASSQAFGDFFGSQFQNIAGGGGFGQGGIDFANQQGSQSLGQTFGGAMDASFATPDQAFQQFGQFSAQNAAFGQSAGMNALASANDFGNRQFGKNEGIAQNLFGFGQNALANGNFDQQAAEQIARQRAFARPGEDRAVNSKFQSLFNKGALSSTGGARQLGELGLSQELADIQRVEAGTQFGNQLAQQNRQFGLQAMGQGLGARAQDSQFNLGRANLFSQTGQNLMGFGQNAAQQGLNSQIGLSEMLNSRGQQRFQNSQQLLGFGQQLDQGNMAQIMQMFGGNMALNQNMQNLMALSGNLSSQRSAANAKSGQIAMSGAGSPFGSFLEGAGSAYLGGQG